MTNEQLIAERTAMYEQRTTQYALRGAVLASAEAAGVEPDARLPAHLQAAYDSYSREIGRLDAVIADLDRQIANDKEQNQ